MHKHTLHGAEIGAVRRKGRWRLSPVAVREVARLVGRGLVREIGTGPQDPTQRYFKAEPGPA